MSRLGLERIFDANNNRAAEGLRVLEDCARFLLEDETLSRRAKELRHRLRREGVWEHISRRDSGGDIGTSLKVEDEVCRFSLADLITANARRSQEALRVCDETAKLCGITTDMESIRYACYDLERDLLALLPRQRLWQERLYVLIDTQICSKPEKVAAAAAGSGAGIIQLRGKNLSHREYAGLAAKILRVTRETGALFVVNDHVALAAAIGADGIHVGQADMSPEEVRRVVGPLMIIGVSAHSREQALTAMKSGADYCGIGPIYATETKSHEPPQGPELLDSVFGRLGIPTYAIGGLDVKKVSQLRPRIPHGVAVAGAVCSAEDPAAVCREIRTLLDQPT